MDDPVDLFDVVFPPPRHLEDSDWPYNGHFFPFISENEGLQLFYEEIAPTKDASLLSYMGGIGSFRIISGLRVVADDGQELHRCVIHPKFGNYVLLGTVLLAAEASDYDRPLADSPCLECKLCVTACPTGAISADGHFNFSACITHNYREFSGGFTNWIEQLAGSKNASDYRRRVTDAETASMWQSLTCGGTYKCVYCLAVCPAGEEAIGPFLTDKRAYLNEVVRPLRKKAETVYVVPGSDAEAHIVRRFPWKHIKRVGNGLRPRSIKAFLGALPLVFQREQSAGLDATYHFTFTGEEECQATVVIRDKTVRVSHGHVGTAGLRVTADSRWWLGFLAKDRSLLWGLLRGKLRLRGSPRLLSAFAKCFPS